MEFEERRVIRVQGVKCHTHRSSSTHKRSKSDSDNTSREDKFGSSPDQLCSKLDMGKAKDYIGIRRRSLPDAEVQHSLKQEILQLEKRLLGQFKTRCALEKALGCSSSAVLCSNDTWMPKTTKELIREIALLELEVMYLEQYLLSLYRKAFSHQIAPLSADTARKETLPPSSRLEMFQDDDDSTQEASSEKEEPGAQFHQIREACESICKEKNAGADVRLGRSSVSQRATRSARISPTEESLARALRSSHSQPLAFPKEEKNHASSVISLADYLGANIADHVPETPNKLSEDMVRCMCAIYCRLAEPPLVCHGPPSSPVSSLSSITELSVLDTPIHRREPVLDYSRLIHPFQVEGLREFSGPYASMVEVPSISRDPQRLKDVEDMLQNYKSILQRLRKVNPRKMKHEEKLAFWINIHNALMMHAYVEYGIPQNNVKKTSLLIKASCNIGGGSVNAAIIQGSILSCRTHCPAQWLQSLLFPRLRSKAGDRWQGYTIERQEPLLHFALCSGNHSEPAVRVYTPKRLYQQLEAAKEEFIRATVRIRKEHKIVMPRVVDLYAKDMKLSSQALLDMVHHHLCETLRKSMQGFPQARSGKIIEWEPHNFSFRFLLSKELAFA
ncbi:Ternary complex factor MIP1 [Musa troglodytarum]|uniref:Ternary complex factor MIP1 n=1 Tax=Musa troglodytarum TaxID=320322 RepID=A0A9E7KIK6_9LILI|nr:Ternary complex factor MIP1 [Musa troglodytarum]